MFPTESKLKIKIARLAEKSVDQIRSTFGVCPIIDLCPSVLPPAIPWPVSENGIDLEPF